MQGGLPRQSSCWQHRPKPCTDNQVRKGNRRYKALGSDPGEPVNGFSGARVGPCYQGQAISVASSQPVSRTETGGGPPTQTGCSQRTLPSSPPVTMYWPSGEYARDTMLLKWPCCLST